MCDVGYQLSNIPIKRYNTLKQNTLKSHVYLFFFQRHIITHEFLHQFMMAKTQLELIIMYVKVALRTMWKMNMLELILSGSGLDSVTMGDRFFII